MGRPKKVDQVKNEEIFSSKEINRIRKNSKLLKNLQNDFEAVADIQKLKERSQLYNKIGIISFILAVVFGIFSVSAEVFNWKYYDLNRMTGFQYGIIFMGLIIILFSVLNSFKAHEKVLKLAKKI